MVTVDRFKEVFVDKLQRTGSQDEAFKKAIWIAYNEGLLTGLTTPRPDRVVQKTAEILQKGYGL